MSEFIELIVFSDPICPWSWGNEALIRKIETKYEGIVKVRHIMGGLVKDAHNISLNIDEANASMIDDWSNAAAKHKMPVKTDIMKIFSDKDYSSYPQNISYKAALMEGEVVANKFLRRMREATAYEGLQTNQFNVLMQLALEVGIDQNRFLTHLQDDSAYKAFKEDLAFADKYGINAFPAFLIKYNKREMLIKDRTYYETIRATIRGITDYKIDELFLEKDAENVLKFIKKYGKVAKIEIMNTFLLDDEDYDEIINLLEKDKLIKLLDNQFIIA